MNSSPLSYERKGLCRCTLGIQGRPPRTTSSMLGCVAAVIGMVSPSQPSPAVIQSMWISFIGSGVASATRPWSVELAMRFPLWKPDLPCRVIRCDAKSPQYAALRRDCTESKGMCPVLFFLPARPEFGLGRLEYLSYRR